MSTLTERQTAERVRALIGLADQLRVPGHRRTAESCMAAQDEVRAGLRDLYKDLTGEAVPREERGGRREHSLRQAGGFTPAAILRDRERRAARA